jgi:hypothetical protein
MENKYKQLTCYKVDLSFLFAYLNDYIDSCFENSEVFGIDKLALCTEVVPINYEMRVSSNDKEVYLAFKMDINLELPI